MRRLLRWYGAGPLHLLALLAGFALAGYAALQLVPSRPLAVAVWFLGAVIGHDLLLMPLYSLADRSALAVIRHRAPGLPAVEWINYARVPAALSGLLLLVWFPLILRLTTAYQASTTLSPAPYLWHWLAVTGALFLLSAVAFAMRLRHAPRAALAPDGDHQIAAGQDHPAWAPSPEGTARRAGSGDGPEPAAALDGPGAEPELQPAVAEPGAAAPPASKSALNHTVPERGYSSPGCGSHNDTIGRRRVPGSEGGGSVREYQQYIGGEWVGASSLFDDLDPYRATVIARIPAGTRADAARAVDAAAAAFPAWADLPPAEKQALFLHAANIVERRRDEITALLAAETGCAGGFAGFQVLTAARLLRQAANWGYLPVGEVIRSDTPGTFALALRKPLGVVAGISPWNGAHVLAWRTVVNPLAFGNTVVLKPSEQAPVSAGLLLPEIMAEAGFPAGVINVITHAPGAAEPIADEFFERPEVRCINFTGSSATGRLLAERAGRHLKRCVLELGGYNPLIVLADADLDYAVEATAFAAFFHQGQICMNARKVLVERPVYDIFVSRLVERAGSLPVGDPAAAGTVIGPLISPAARERVAREVEEAVTDGAKVLAGGTADGPCYRPTILADVPAGARIHSEETFGPVLVAQPVDDADEAVAVANSTRYGLSAGLITGDNQRGFALARRIDAGAVHVNNQTIADEPQLPLGGVKDSGWGRSGPQSMADFTEVQWITTRDGGGSYPI